MKRLLILSIAMIGIFAIVKGENKNTNVESTNSICFDSGTLNDLKSYLEEKNQEIFQNSEELSDLLTKSKSIIAKKLNGLESFENVKTALNELRTEVSQKELDELSEDFVNLQISLSENFAINLYGNNCDECATRNHCPNPRLYKCLSGCCIPLCPFPHGG